MKWGINPIKFNEKAVYNSVSEEFTAPRGTTVAYALVFETKSDQRHDSPSFDFVSNLKWGVKPHFAIYGIIRNYECLRLRIVMDKRAGESCLATNGLFTRAVSTQTIVL